LNQDFQITESKRRKQGDLTREEASRGRALEHKQKSSEELRDIGFPADVSDIELRKKLDEDPAEFLKWLSPDVFKWPFSNDQLDSIRQTENVINRGGLQAVADPRGTGKTQRALRMAIRAILKGRRKFVCVVAATEKKSRAIIKAIKTILCYSPHLHELYPAELHGFKELKGNGRKAAGQLCNGVETAIGLSADQIIFPTIPGSQASGAIISSCGITGDIRGQFHTRQDGSVIRPDLCLLDDPQTKESAQSPEQTQTRLETIEADVLGLAGPDTSIACMVLCTVIAASDLSEQLLSMPKWHGKRTKTINQWPKNMKAWDAYFEDYDEAIRLNQPERINQNYLARRKVLDEGCELAWNHRIEGHEIDGVRYEDASAIQTAMHIWHRMGPSAFAFEFQNDRPSSLKSKNVPTAKGLASKLIGLEKWVVPRWATKLTCYVDVHLDALYWWITSWADDFTGHDVAYGVFPEQERSYFTLNDVSPTLRDLSGSSQPQGAIRWGLENLVDKLLGTGYPNEDGVVLHIGKLGIDEGFNQKVVHEFIKRSKYGATLIPCKGLSIRAGNKPISEYKQGQGTEIIGDNWTTKINETTKIRFAKHDTNYWKTFACDRIAAVKGEKGSKTIFGARPEVHKMALDHCTSETPVLTFRADGTRVWEWSDPLFGQDNHLWDCMINNGPLASMLGCYLEGETPPKEKKKRKIIVMPEHMKVV
jgi:hypothetical protein